MPHLEPSFSVSRQKFNSRDQTVGDVDSDFTSVPEMLIHPHFA